MCRLMTVQELIEKAPELSDEGLERMGAKLFKGVNVAELVAQGRV